MPAVSPVSRQTDRPQADEREDEDVARIGESTGARLQEPEKRDGNGSHAPIGIVHARITGDDAEDEDHDGRGKVSQPHDDKRRQGTKHNTRADRRRACQHVGHDDE